MLHPTRVLLASEDCPEREFDKFGIFSVNTLREANIDISEEGEINVVDSMLRSLCQEAKNFPFSAEDHEKIYELKGAQRKAIPTFSRVAACTSSDFYPTVEEFLSIFTSPISHKKDDDWVYPVEPPIQYETLKLNK